MGHRSDELATNLYYLVLIASAAFTGENIVEPILPLRIVAMGASLLDLGAIVGVASIAAFLSRLPAGFLCRRIRFRTFVSAALLGEGLAYLMYGLAPSYEWLFPVRVLWGVTSAIFMVSMAATISNMSPKERIGWAVGTYLTSYGLGTMLGPIVCSVLLSALSYAQIMMSASLLPLIGFVLLNMRFGSSALGNSCAGVISSDARIGTNGNSSLTKAFSELFSIISRRRVALAGILHFLFSVSITFLDTVFIIYAVTQLGMDPSVATLMLAARGVANALVRSPAGSISDKFGQKLPFVVSFGSLIVSYLILATYTDIWLMGFAMVVLGAAWGVRVVLEWTATQDEIPAESRAIASSFLPLVWDVAHSSGAVAVGVLASFVPVTTILFLCAGLMLVAILVVLAFWPSGRISG
jgi:MFS family permease